MFKRKIYDKLVKWKQEEKGHKAILIEGARRIGKSTVAEEFAKANYKSYILIDFNQASPAIKKAFFDYGNDLESLFMILSIFARRRLNTHSFY